MNKNYTFVKTLSERSGENDRGAWNVLNFLATYQSGSYTKSIKLAAFGSDAAIVKQMASGDTFEGLEETAALESKKTPGEWYNDTRILFVKKTSNNGAPATSSTPEPITRDGEASDDLPF